jgi:ATP-dependent Lhr-like helicase
VVEPELLEPGIEALAGLVRDRRLRRLAIERIDGDPVGGTDAERLLVAHGFLQAPRRVVLRA